MPPPVPLQQKRPRHADRALHLCERVTKLVIDIPDSEADEEEDDAPVGKNADLPLD